jgi:hypothetical protein
VADRLESLSYESDRIVDQVVTGVKAGADYPQMNADFHGKSPAEKTTDGRGGTNKMAVKEKEKLRNILRRGSKMQLCGKVRRG